MSEERFIISKLSNVIDASNAVGQVSILTENGITGNGAGLLFYS